MFFLGYIKVYTFNVSIVSNLFIGFYTGSSCSWEDVDYYGSDLWMEKSNSPENCSKICENNKDCKKWTFHMHEFSEKCLLKKSNTKFSREKCIGCTTGFRNSKLQRCGHNGKYYFFTCFPTPFFNYITDN